MEPELGPILEQQDWETIGADLVAFGIWWAQRYPWYCSGGWELAKGETIEDIVQTVIEKTFNGTRRYDPSRGPLIPWLKNQVKSEIRNLFNSAARRHEARTEERPKANLDEAAGDANSPEFPDDLTPGPEEQALTREEVDRRYSALFEAMAGDAELEEMLMALIGGCEYEPRFLADYLHVPVQNINNRVRRWDRRIEKLLAGGEKR